MPQIVRSFFLLCALLLPFTSHAAPTVLVYGDSLSAAYGIPRDRGWVHLLQERLTDQGYPHAVVNASISGETTSGGLSRIDSTLNQYHPQLVILELGANDGLRGLPVMQMRSNLGAMIQACKKHHAQVLLVGMRIPPNYGPRYARSFSESYPQLAKKYRVPLLDFLLEGIAGRSELTQDDGLHPNVEAQPTVLENIWQMLLPILGKPVKG